MKICSYIGIKIIISFRCSYYIRFEVQRKVCQRSFPNKETCLFFVETSCQTTRSTIHCRCITYLFVLGCEFANNVPSTLFRTYGTYDRGIYAAHVTSFHCTLIYSIAGRAFGQNYMFHKCYVQPQVTNARFSALVLRIIREKQYHYASVSR